VAAQQEETSRSTATETAVHFRQPEVADAASIWCMVRDSGALDVNSPYAYLLLCDHFADTCVVACDEQNQPIAFVTAYSPPQRPNTVFVWQIGVNADWRKQGLAKRLLHELLKLPACANVRFVEATVTPSNVASRRLFAALARDVEAELNIATGYEACQLSAEPSHEAEELFRIGPLQMQS
jgi:L-2,4-diaminobutyric acid acetyltransferase